VKVSIGRLPLFSSRQQDHRTRRPVVSNFKYVWLAISRVLGVIGLFRIPRYQGGSRTPGRSKGPFLCWPVDEIFFSIAQHGLSGLALLRRRRWLFFRRLLNFGHADLYLCKAAIHAQLGPRDVAAVVTCEKYRGLRDVIGCAEPADRNTLDHPLPQLGRFC